MWVEPALGLRDRKKIQTRDAIRREAMRLIKANGYAQRSGRDANELEVRVFVGALSGGLMASLDGHLLGLTDRMQQTLDYMEAGMQFR
ncbi:MAG: hypothetical protein ACXWZR_07755 [Mycobacterium sp.]